MKTKIHFPTLVCLALFVALFVQETQSARPTTEQISARRANSILAKIADTITPGTFAKLTPLPFLASSDPFVYKDSTYYRSLLTTYPPSRGLNILGWTDDSHWDSLTGQFVHMGFRQTRKFILYSEESNSWRSIRLPLNHDSAQSPCFQQKFGHIYGTNALDIENNRFYHYYYGTSIDSSTYFYPYPASISYFDLTTETWTRLPALDHGTMLIEYFNAMKGLVTLTDGILRFFSDSSQTWRILAENISVDGYHSTARQNPFKEEILFAGGNESIRSVGRLKKDGTFESLADAPFDISVQSVQISIDPASGRYLIYDQEELQYLEFDSDRNTYRSLPFPSVYTKYDMPTCAFVPEYNVVLWQHGEKMYVYKHDTTSAGTSASFAPANNAKQPASLAISPNPSSTGNIKFSVAGNRQNTTIEIFNIAGKKIETIDITQSAARTISRTFSNGLYFAQLKSDGHHMNTIRFIVLW